MEIEELQNENLKLREEKDQLQSDYNSITSENEELKKRIQKLQEHNQELFIRCTSPSKKDDDEGKTKLKTIEEIAKEMRGKK